MEARASQQASWGAVAAPDDGDGGNAGGVLGNLPRTRPGQRSDRRADPGPRPRAGERSPAAAPRDTAPGAPEEVGRRDQPSLAGEAPGSSGALTGAVRVAGRAARLGLDAAGAVLRRLPRP